MRLRTPLRTPLLTAAALGLALSLGCHTSTKAPAHVFRDASLADAPLPVRLRSSAEHDEARVRVGEPYVLEIAMPEGGALLYYGGAHTRERGHPQVADIEERWSAFGPSVALCEGRKRRHFFGLLVEPFAGLPEPTLVHKLARANGVDLVSLEPEYVDEVRSLLATFTAEEVALYFFLRVYASEADGTADEGLARDLLAKRTDVDGLRGSLVTLDDVDAAWARAAPGEDGWRSLAREPRIGVLARVSDASRSARGEHMARTLVDLVRAGERVFAVVGSGHVIRQEWALRTMLGAEPAWDQPSDGD
ncbi:MAG: hypothetical protein AAGI22_19735 [Planctomycetota bacterium]